MDTAIILKMKINFENFDLMAPFRVAGHIWANDHNKQHEEKFGYKKDHSTIDNIFASQSIMQKY